jgi:hypothetical protein
VDNIVNFPGFRMNHELYDEEAKDILSRVPREMRDKIRHAMESSTKKYIVELSKPMDILIPENCTADQLDSIRAAIEKHQNICKELMQELAIARAELAIIDSNKS